MDFLPNVQTKIGKNLAKSASELVTQLGFGGKKIIFVSDENIWNNCARFFNAEFAPQKLILQNPKADEENVKKIIEKIADFDLIISLGSGVISDLCKYASAKTDIPYAIFASAPSMNGYLSKNASITINQHKKTLPATLPMAVWCDLDILKSAPSDMKKAGIGDAMCFWSCWFDWLLSHLLLETEFNSEVFAFLTPKMQDFAKNYHNFDLNNDEFLQILIEILLLSGAAMTLAVSSAPASQSEHLIAHCYTMKYPQKAENILHGLQIATTCLTSAKIQEELIAQDAIEMRDSHFDMEKIAKFFGQKIAKECQEEYKQKQELIKQNRKFLQQELAQNWQDYCKILSRIIMPEQNLREIFKHFAIDVGHGAIGLEYQEYQELVGYARFIRNRFTCLDL